MWPLTQLGCSSTSLVDNLKGFTLGVTTIITDFHEVSQDAGQTCQATKLAREIMDATWSDHYDNCHVKAFASQPWLEGQQSPLHMFEIAATCLIEPTISIGHWTAASICQVTPPHLKELSHKARCYSPFIPKKPAFLELIPRSWLLRHQQCH